MRSGSFSVRQQVLLRDPIILSVCCNGIFPLVFVGHRQSRRRHFRICQRGLVRLQPRNVLLARVRSAAVPPPVLLDELLREADEPPVVLHALAYPYGARVLHMRGLVPAARCFRNICMSRVQQLRRLQDHLYNVLVAVEPRTQVRVAVQEEYVHFDTGGGGAAAGAGTDTFSVNLASAASRGTPRYTMSILIVNRALRSFWGSIYYRSI